MSATRTTTPSARMTHTLTLEHQSQSSIENQYPETLVLRLNRKKKKVTWKEGTVDNEFMGKKSSKKCCIFHKQKPFDEDYSDDEEGNPTNRDNHSHDHGEKGCCSNHGGGGAGSSSMGSD